MPPKQKDVKKGPAYKAATLSKDIVPAQIKEPPRQPKPLKIPESFPEASKNNETLAAVFQQWPTQQTVKAHDFGINSQQKFKDGSHDVITKYIEGENINCWKHIGEIVPVQSDEEEQEEVEKGKVIEEQTRNQIESLKDIDKEEKDAPEAKDCVIETFMRSETQEEMQARLKQQAEKAQKAAKEKKKAAKKQQPKQEGPIQVSDVKMSDIITKKHMLKPAIWIGSQLQMIKQRNLVDVNTGQAVWKKIYPQQNGVPQLTKSGKYWVKLLYMGKYVKIEVDDRVPLSQQQKQLFPLSDKYNEKWTLILTKAIIKYLSQASRDGIIGNGLVMYALTGMISQNVPLHHYKEWQELEDMMNNEHYERKDVVVSCFSSNGEKSFKKMTKVRVQPEEGEQPKEEDEFQERQLDTRVINGYAYCIGDYFDNGNFNMVFSQQKTQKEMTLKHQYNQMCKISLSNKTREEKLEYRKKKKELKEKLGLEEKKRLEMISKAPVRYHFLKLLSHLAVQCDYGEKQILLAKKCAVNKLSQPPNYDIPHEKEEKDTKSMHSVSASVIKYKEESELFPNIHDFSAIQNLTELLERPQEGVWIQDLDLLEYFDCLQIFYNPTVFANKIIDPLTSKKANTFTTDQTKQILVVEKANQQEQSQSKIRLLFGFGYQASEHDKFSPYTILQKFDFDSFRATSKVVILNSDISSKIIELKNQNSVFKVNTMSKGNYSYWISSDNNFKLVSIADYLCEFQNYQKKNFTFQYPAIEGKTYFPLNKLRLSQSGEESNTILVKLVNAKDELAACLSYRLVTIPKDGQMTNQQTEGIISKNQQKILLAHEYSRFVIEPQNEYYLIVQIDSQENIPDGSLQLLLLAKNEGFSADQCEQVEPVKYCQKYVPNKYGLICRERIFTNNQCNSSIVVKLAQFEEAQAAGGGKGAKKGGKEEPTTELIDKPYTDQKTIMVKVIKNDTILYEAIGVNEVTIPNLKFQSTKANAGVEYYLQVQFDMRTWPDSSKKSQQTEKICWVAQISSTDSIALVRDTKQQDKEKEIRKSWQDRQAGRADRAKKARRKFLIEMKKENGEQLTEEEEQILNAPRLTRKQIQEEQKKNQEKKGGKGAKKDEKKGKDKKQEVIEEKPVERQPPKSNQNFMNQIKEFLQILQNCVVRYQVLDSGEARIRSPQQIRSIKQAAIMAGQNRASKLIRNVERRQTMKIKQKQKKETISIFFSEIRQQIKEKYNSYIEWRAQDMEKDKTKEDKERFLIDVVSQEKPNISQADLKKNITQYTEINGHNPYLADVATMVAKNIRIANLTEKINGLMTAWQIEQMKNIKQEIDRDKIQGIDEQIMKQFKQMLEQVEKNPGIVAEKQAEAKKAKKGGKK